jgi:hypothetical protein
MDDTLAVTQPDQLEEEITIEDDRSDNVTPETKPAQEKKPSGIEHDPYEWGKCALTASIVWLPDGSVMLGVRNHLDAPIITVLTGDSLTTLPGHAAELPLPTLETIADLLAQLREELPLRAKAKADRDQAVQKKAKEVKTRKETVQKIAKPASAQTPASTTPQPKPTSVGKMPAPMQASLFSLMTGGN